jgi:hypothetical protein
LRVETKGAALDTVESVRGAAVEVTVIGKIGVPFLVVNSDPAAATGTVEEAGI